MPQIINLRTEPQEAFYVGRKAHSTAHFGNPFSHRIEMGHASVRVATRVIAIASYERWLAGDDEFKDVEPKRRQWILSNLYQLRDRDLSCWCAPEPCHAEVLMRLAAKIEKEEL